MASFEDLARINKRELKAVEKKEKKVFRKSESQRLSDGSSKYRSTAQLVSAIQTTGIETILSGSKTPARTLLFDATQQRVSDSVRESKAQPNRAGQLQVGDQYCVEAAYQSPEKIAPGLRISHQRLNYSEDKYLGDS